MLRTMIVVNTFVCVLAMTMAGVSYAYTYTNPVSIQCSPSSEEAGWKQLDGSPDSQYTLTTLGIEIAGEGLVTKWDDLSDFENSIMHDGVVNVVAKCIASGNEIDMFPDDDLPTLICPKGDGIIIRFLSPNSSVPNQYIYRATLTVTRDDPPAPPLSLKSVSTSALGSLGVSGVVKGLSPHLSRHSTW